MNMTDAGAFQIYAQALGGRAAKPLSDKELARIAQQAIKCAQVFEAELNAARETPAKPE